MTPVIEWNQAVQVQAMRILIPGAAGVSGPVTKQADVYLFAMALRNLLRAVNLVREAVSPERQEAVDAAIESFDAEIPDAVAFRDVLEHFDEYMQGQGRLQRRRPGFPTIQWSESQGEGHFAFTIGVVGHPPFTLDVGKSRDAAHRLYDAAVEAVHG